MNKITNVMFQKTLCFIKLLTEGVSLRDDDILTTILALYSKRLKDSQPADFFYLINEQYEFMYIAY